MESMIAQRRDFTTKAKQLRRAGIVPCVICGTELEESLAIQMDKSTAMQLKRTKRNGSKVSIQVDGKVYPSLIKNLEYDGLKDEITHISFHVLSAGKRCKSIAHIILLNKDKVPGVLEQMQIEVPHVAAPEDLIDTVSVDLADMPVGTILTIGDIPEFQNPKIELQMEAETIVLRIRDKKRAEGRASESSLT